MLYFLFHYTQHNLESGNVTVNQGYFTNFNVLAARLRVWSIQQPKTWKYTLTPRNLWNNCQAERGVKPADKEGWYGVQGHDWEAPNRKYA